MNPPAQADEILSAVRELLDAAARGGGSAPAFDLRVAARLLEVLQRESAQGGAVQRAEREGLLAWLPGALKEETTEALRERLCARLAAGECGLGDAPLMDRLWQDALARLAIDSPNHRWCEVPGIG